MAIALECLAQEYLEKATPEQQAKAYSFAMHAKVAIVSVMEGEDKSINYSHMFRASNVMILPKTNLLSYVPFDVARCLDYARQVNPDIEIFRYPRSLVMTSIAGTSGYSIAIALSF
nr:MULTISPECIES: GTP-binding protein [unclassified Leptolyngbya]